MPAKLPWPSCRLVQAVLAAVLCGGCTTVSSFKLPAAAEPPVVHVCEAAFRAAEPLPPEVGLQIKDVRRGTRGGSFTLVLENNLPNHTLVFDWSRVRYRLGSGQYRRCFDDEEYMGLALKFTFRAYGCPTNQKLVGEHDVPLRFPRKGEVLRIEPGKEGAMVLHFGAPEEETTLCVSLREALSWQDRNEAIQPVAGFGDVILTLPDLTPEEHAPSLWPCWLHFGIVVTNGR